MAGTAGLPKDGTLINFPENLFRIFRKKIPDRRLYTLSRAAEEQVLAESISAFLRTQSADNRYIFLRRYWYGEDIAAIAQGLGCGESRVKSALFRTRKALRGFLEKEGITV